MKTDPDALATFLLELGIEAKQISRGIDAMRPMLSAVEKGIYRFCSAETLDSIRLMKSGQPSLNQREVVCLSLPQDMDAAAWLDRIWNPIERRLRLGTVRPKGMDAAESGGVPLTTWLEKGYEDSIVNPLILGSRSARDSYWVSLCRILQHTLPQKAFIGSLPEHLRSDRVGLKLWRHVMAAYSYLFGALALGRSFDVGELIGLAEILPLTIPLGLDDQDRWLLPTL
jgi:hypothetical protein